MDSTLLNNKLSQLPDNLKSEVSDFIDFLLSKNKKGGKATFGSAKGMFKMKKDFDSPLEDINEYQ